MRLDRIHAAPMKCQPFNFLFAAETIDSAELPAIIRDFPETVGGGSFDVRTLQPGPAFAQLIDDLRGEGFRTLIGDKFGVDLRPYPLHITVRGHVRERDGVIHTDSRDKILTGLLYLNAEWHEVGGRLRLLRDGKDIDDYALEVPPVGGNMVIFRRGDRSWHGHLPAEGRRLSLQFNWVSGETYARREQVRHRVSAWLKRLSGSTLSETSRAGATPPGTARA